MSEDKELLKKCWDEYTDQFDLFGDEWHDLGCDEIFKAGFEAAKLSQPAITVPAYDMHHYAPVRNLMAKMDSAGIKYTIGE